MLDNFVCPTPVTFDVPVVAPFAVEAGTEYIVVSDVALWYQLGIVNTIAATATHLAAPYSGYCPANKPMPLSTGSNTYMDVIAYGSAGHGTISKSKNQS